MFATDPSFVAGVARIFPLLCAAVLTFTACLQQADRKAAEQADVDAVEIHETQARPTEPEEVAGKAESNAVETRETRATPARPEARPAPEVERAAPRRRDVLARHGTGVMYASAPMALAPDGAGLDREQYDFVAEDGFIDPRRVPLSTFSIDVDTASYSNVRRLLRDGRQPPKGAVRIEELVNYFRYDYPGPRGDRPFSIVTEVSQAPWQPEHQLVMIGLRGLEMEERDLPPRNLTFLLDVSGSMGSPDKLALVVRAMRTLVATLRPEDRVSIVVYAGASGLVLPPTSGADRAAIDEALGRLQAGGSTNGGEGIRLAYRQARQSFDPGGINRVILATDGDFNVGTTSRSDLVELIERERESGVFLTVLGVGTGNLQDASMEQLADHGNGNYAYLDSDAEARKVLVAEGGGTLVTVAKDVKIQVEFNPARVSGYRLIGYENRRLEDRDFNDDRKDAGEIGAGHTVTALYEVVPAGIQADTGDVDPLRYQGGSPSSAGDASGELLIVKLRYKEPDGERSKRIDHPVIGTPTPWRDASQDLRFAAAVATFGMLLRQSEYAGDATWNLSWQLARDALGEDPRGYRSEFLGLVALARDLADRPSAADDDRG